MEKHKFSDTRPERSQWVWVQGVDIPVKVSRVRDNAFWRHDVLVNFRDDGVWAPCVNPFSVEGGP